MHPRSRRPPRATPTAPPASRGGGMPRGGVISAAPPAHVGAGGKTAPIQTAADYVNAAVAQGIEVLAVTDHNSVAFVRDAINAGVGQPILVLPGVEVSSRDGHLLAIFAPDALDELEGFAAATTL